MGTNGSGNHDGPKTGFVTIDNRRVYMLQKEVAAFLWLYESISQGVLTAEDLKNEMFTKRRAVELFGLPGKIWGPVAALSLLDYYASNPLMNGLPRTNAKLHIELTRPNGSLMETDAYPADVYEMLHLKDMYEQMLQERAERKKENAARYNTRPANVKSQQEVAPGVSIDYDPAQRKLIMYVGGVPTTEIDTKVPVHKKLRAWIEPIAKAKGVPSEELALMFSSQDTTPVVEKTEPVPEPPSEVTTTSDADAVLESDIVPAVETVDINPDDATSTADGSNPETDSTPVEITAAVPAEALD